MAQPAKHTPGPWTIAYYVSQDGQGGSSHYSAKVGNKTIARTINQIATPTDEANMRLIAAAPAMYEALQAAYKLLREWTPSGEDNQGEVEGLIESALTQADGKQ